MPDIMPYQPPIIIESQKADIISKKLSSPHNEQKSSKPFSEYVKDKPQQKNNSENNKIVEKSNHKTKEKSEVKPYDDNEEISIEDIANIFLNEGMSFIEKIKSLEENMAWQALSFEEQSELFKDLLEEFPALELEISEDIRDFEADQELSKTANNEQQNIVSIFSYMSLNDKYGDVNISKLDQLEVNNYKENIEDFNAEISDHDSPLDITLPDSKQANTESDFVDFDKISAQNTMPKVDGSYDNNITEKALIETKIATIPLKDNISLIITRPVDNPQKISINLEPAGMGEAELLIENHDNGIVAVIKSEKSETLDMIRKESASLERYLSEAGLNLTGGGLDFRQEHKSDSDSNDYVKSLSLEEYLSEPAPSSDNYQTSQSIAPNKDGKLDIRL